MIDLTNCIEIGFISKSHSVRGQIVLRLKQPSFNNFKNLESVFIEIDGLPVPFFISEYRTKNNDELILTLDDVTSEEQTHELIDCKVWSPLNQLDDSPENNLSAPDALIGYEVVDKKYGSLGTLVEIEDLSQNPLLRVMKGKTEILIPLQAEFILDINDSEKTILVNTPEGLLDLF